MIYRKQFVNDRRTSLQFCDTTRPALSGDDAHDHVTALLADTVDRSLWQALRNALVASLHEPDGRLRTRASEELVGFGRSLLDDPVLAERLDRRAADASVFLVERYGTEVTGVITHTIEQWDGKEAAARIESFVGRDLQFIRINGTLVGGLVGVLIHAVSLLAT